VPAFMHGDDQSGDSETTDNGATILSTDYGWGNMRGFVWGALATWVGILPVTADVVGGLYVPRQDQFESVQPGLDDTRRTAASVAIFKVCQFLRDCETAKFRVLLVHRLGTPKDGSIRDDEENGYSVCGQVNAKNAFGGYTGWTSFILATAKWADHDWWNPKQLDSSESMLVVEQEIKHGDDNALDDPTEVMKHDWQKFCW
jgi:hypothetical protein